MYGLALLADVSDIIARALEQADGIILVLERDRAEDPMVVHANDVFCRLTGRTRQAWIGDRLSALFGETIDADLRANLTAALRAAQPLHAALPCRWPEAATGPIWLSVHLMPTTAHNGACTHMVLLGRDISAQHVEQERQEAAQQLLARAFTAVEAAVAITALNGRFLMTNPAFDRLLNSNAASLVGRSLFDFTAPPSATKASQANTLQQTDLQPYHITLQLRRPDASTIDVRASAVPVVQQSRQRFCVLTLTPTAPHHAADAVPQPQGRFQIAGKIRFVGLDDVKATIGPRWTALADRAMDTAEHIIRKNVGPRDTWSRSEDNGFLVCFADASEDEASFRAAAMARDIRHRLIGQGIDPAVAQVSATVARVAETNDPAVLATQLAAAEREAQACLAARLAADHWALEPIFARDDARPVAQYLLHPGHTAPTGPQPIPPELAERALDFAAAQADAPTDAQKLLVEVPFALFLTRRRMDAYIDHLARRDPRLHQRLLLLITGLPPGVPHSRVLEISQHLRPHCRGIGFVIDDLELPRIDMDMAGGAILALHSCRWEAGHRLPEPRLTRLAAALHAYRGRLLLRGLASAAVAQRLTPLGVDLFSLHG